MMTEKHSSETVLGGYRVLDLTDEKGPMCGWALANLGAEVIKIEPPEGDRSRNIPPFYGDVPHPEKSLFFFAYNTNKKSITLNLKTTDGQNIFKELVRSADFIVESFRPGYMESLELGYSMLSRMNPRIIMTSITPFGQTGPYASFKSSDLMCGAMSGFMYLTGYPDRPPLRISVPQAYSLGGAEGAIATMAAHYFRERTGEGQYVDVSIRESMVKTTAYSIPWTEKYGVIKKRSGPYWTLRGENTRVHFPCKDGSVTFVLPLIGSSPKFSGKLVEWMDSEGMAGDRLKEVDWENIEAGSVSRELQRDLEEAIVGFCRSKSRDELMEGLVSRKITAAPVNTIQDIAANPQLEARDFWEEVDHPDMNTSIRYPGPFIKATETPCVKKHRAPMIGEHNAEIYMNILGKSGEELILLKGAGVI
ncbi:MAG: CoA transferase [Deltaproteobacteria bacterium]|nr:CoA transferase [Deltaproteobacteria bacterium]